MSARAGPFRIYEYRDLAVLAVVGGSLKQTFACSCWESATANNFIGHSGVVPVVDENVTLSVSFTGHGVFLLGQ
jgi:hypothetical protein